MTKKLKLSQKASEVVKKLTNSDGSNNIGLIAAIDPQTGEVYYGKNIVEASRSGRKGKNDPKAVFFFVRVGYPSVHVLRTINLKGYIDKQYFPKIKGVIHNKQLKLQSALTHTLQNFDFIVDTGFSGAIVMDTKILQSIDNDFLGEDNVILAGGINYSVRVYLVNISVGSILLNEVEITEMDGENLIGIALMRSICKKVIFDFNTEEIFFEN